jgi:drug/metabolite transporter (DMT)-like permease
VRRDSERLAKLLLGVVVLIWGANFIVMKAAFRELPPLVFNAVRMTVAAALMGGIWLARERQRKMPWSDWLKLAGVGLLGNTCYQVLFAIGLDLTTSAISSLLIGTIPIWTRPVGDGPRLGEDLHADVGGDRSGVWRSRARHAG